MTPIDRPSDCADHRDLLVAFIDRRHRGEGTIAALAHLDRCRVCHAELAAVAQTVTALRRIHLEVAAAEPAIDAWPRLRTRLTEHRGPRWLWPAKVGGMVAATMLVAVLVGPVALRGPIVQSDDLVPLPPPAAMPASEADIPLESQLLLSRRPPAPATPVPTTIVRMAPGDPRLYPDGIAPQRKEVHRAQATGQPPDAI